MLTSEHFPELKGSPLVEVTSYFSVKYFLDARRGAGLGR